jgi:hypothetical protein
MAVPDEVKAETQRALAKLLRAGGLSPEDAASAAEYAVEHDHEDVPA